MSIDGSLSVSSLAISLEKLLALGDESESTQRDVLADFPPLQRADSTDESDGDAPKKKKKPTGSSTQRLVIDSGHRRPRSAGPDNNEEEDVGDSGSAVSQPDESDSPAGTTGEKKRKRVRNRGSGATHGGQGLRRHAQLQRRALEQADVLRQSNLNIALDAKTSSTGWGGSRALDDDRARVVELHRKGSLSNHLADLAFLPYRPAMLLDANNRVYGYRSTRLANLEAYNDEFVEALERMLSKELAIEETGDASRLRSPNRGHHLSAVIGYMKQYMSEPKVTDWHMKNRAQVDAFLGTDVVARLMGAVCSMVRIHFPGIASRFEASKEWHGLRKRPAFPICSLFWNMAINYPLAGGSVECTPHVDAKNPLGVCVVMSYLLKNSTFDYRRRGWLVLWEAGFVAELPPWTPIIFPSALFFHWNTDVRDVPFKFVVTDGSAPMPDNSVPMGEGDDRGRGSIVLFNQSSMFESSETGFSTLAKAGKKKVSRVADGEAELKRAFLAPSAASKRGETK